MYITVLHENNPGDLNIAKLAQKFLQCTSGLPLETITVRVQDGWLTISGRVSWISQKRAVTQALQSITGVIGISDHLDIRNSKGRTCPN